MKMLLYLLQITFGNSYIR